MTKIVLCFQKEKQNRSRIKARIIALVKVFKMKCFFPFFLDVMMRRLDTLPLQGAGTFPCLN